MKQLILRHKSHSSEGINNSVLRLLQPCELGSAHGCEYCAGEKMDLRQGVCETRFPRVAVSDIS